MDPGGVSGFITQNVIYPDANATVVVLTNSDTADTASAIADKIEAALFVTASPEDATRSAVARKIFADLRQGKIDRTLFSNNGNEYYTPTAVADTARTLSRLGARKIFELKDSGTRGGMDRRTYKVELVKKTFDLVVRQWPMAKLSSSCCYRNNALSLGHDESAGFAVSRIRVATIAMPGCGRSLQAAARQHRKFP